MKLVFSRARALLAGVALIVLTNAVVLAGVAYNRSGEPESVLKLTERELRVYNWSWPENENSSIDLHLTWRVARAVSADVEYPTWYHGLVWLEPAQVRELGFEVPGDLESQEGAQRVHRQPSRRAWVVLEYDGQAYQASVEHARNELERATALANANPGDREFEGRLDTARHAMEREEKFETRLFVVDVGRDEAALRAKYPNRQQYAIVNGRLRAMVDGRSGQQRVIVGIDDLDVDAIRVPHTYRALVEPITRFREGYYDREPHFSATVNFGRRFEPWIAELALL
ncbi:MAG TPA: DUF4824 family protein [Steroidobacter sp.]|uniref:DUF4824 family protein n=1 Tax=Steroidobacter sp. TaxID=1978227 RepID=UPI002ED7EF0E